VVESTAYEYELFDDIEFCSRITVLVVSAFISHLCYHAGETPVERTCNAVKFIILILFCWKGIYLSSTIHLKSFPKTKRKGSTLINHTRSNLIMNTSACFMRIGVAPRREEARDHTDQ
jgi:hypothetical protein